MVAVVGRLFQKWFPAQPNLSYTFIWDKTDAYGQRVYGLSEAVGEFVLLSFLLYVTSLGVNVPSHRQNQHRLEWDQLLVSVSESLNGWGSEKVPGLVEVRVLAKDRLYTQDTGQNILIGTRAGLNGLAESSSSKFHLLLEETLNLCLKVCFFFEMALYLHEPEVKTQ